MFRFEVRPENEYFEVEAGTGKLKVKRTLDFEDLRDDKRITFDLQVSGVMLFCFVYKYLRFWGKMSKISS